MSFFSKLKNRLFRSSSKISEGLDAIVEDGGEEELNLLNCVRIEDVKINRKLCIILKFK